jgi:hypothetical protein
MQRSKQIRRIPPLISKPSEIASMPTDFLASRDRAQRDRHCTRKSNAKRVAAPIPERRRQLMRIGSLPWVEAEDRSYRRQALI